MSMSIAPLSKDNKSSVIRYLKMTWMHENSHAISCACKCTQELE